MSISKIGASLLSQSAETNLALATINLDFSVIKVEAPPEFKPLRNELSAARQNAAEEGIPHVTARKIGALFHDWLPKTPHLIKAYGRRMVEIAQCRTVNPKATKADGVFADHIGIEGTGVWAAATSGAHSIAVYLLACMLARMWSASEAIAIWDELIRGRKKELEIVDESDPTSLRKQLASRIHIPRDDLAQWDASARAWLRSADEAMEKRQKQLMLIIDNLKLPVNTKPDLLDNVRDVWVSAMSTMDRLIQGIPQHAGARKRA
ncbi:hypothetical protein SCUCBS95973_009386 [Sporothrix curviconia]|uniref:Uncharacterized protein n=1 Tax=Sporothrix curviconia TaxID=1260050 RepID=A0ABP0CW49_9PEZI